MKLFVYLASYIILLYACTPLKPNGRQLSDRYPENTKMVQNDTKYKEIQIVKSEPIQALAGNNRGYYYTNSQGRLIDVGKNEKLKKALADSIFLKEKLPEVFIPENAEKIITYGSNNGYTVQFYTGLKIFDQTGHVIKTIDVIAKHPFKVAFDAHGNTYVAGKDPNESDHIALFLWKYDSNGNLLWTVPIAKAPFFNLSVSPDGKYIALNQYDTLDLTTIYSMDGQVVSSIRPALGSVSFLDENRIITSERSWFIVYDFKKSFLKLKSEHVKYDLYGSYPFVVTQKYFTTLCIKNDNSILLSIFDAKTLNFICEKELSYSIHNNYSNPIKIEENNIFLTTNDQIVELVVK